MSGSYASFRLKWRASRLCDNKQRWQNFRDCRGDQIKNYEIRKRWSIGSWTEVEWCGMECSEFPNISYLSKPITDTFARHGSYNTDRRHASSESNCSKWRQPTSIRKVQLQNIDWWINSNTPVCWQILSNAVIIFVSSSSSFPIGVSCTVAVIWFLRNKSGSAK